MRIEIDYSEEQLVGDGTLTNKDAELFEAMLEQAICEEWPDAEVEPVWRGEPSIRIDYDPPDPTNDLITLDSIIDTCWREWLDKLEAN